jgi:hypothetical protein
MLTLSEYADHPEGATDMLVENCGGKPPNDVFKFHVGT